MRSCDSCQVGEGIHHVTARFEIYGPGASKVKIAQFWLCEGCEMASRQVLERDANLSQRVARRLVSDPEFLSRYRDWRDRRRADRRNQA